MRIPFGLGIRAHALGDPIDVVEVSDHLDRVVDRRVVEAVRPEPVRVCGTDAGRCEGQLDGVVAEGARSRIEVGRAVVVLGM